MELKDTVRGNPPTLYRQISTKQKGMTEETLAAFKFLFKGVNMPIKIGKTADWQFLQYLNKRLYNILCCLLLHLLFVSHSMQLINQNILTLEIM